MCAIQLSVRELIADAAKYATAGSPSAWCLIRSTATYLRWDGSGFFTNLKSDSPSTSHLPSQACINLSLFRLSIFWPANNPSAGSIHHLILRRSAAHQHGGDGESPKCYADHCRSFTTASGNDSKSSEAHYVGDASLCLSKISRPENWETVLPYHHLREWRSRKVTESRNGLFDLSRLPDTKGTTFRIILA
jgi:hypothetical protein